MEFDLSIRQLLSSRPCSVISKHSMHNICAYFIYSSFREYGSFLSLLFEIENIRWTLWNMLKTASLTAIIMLYVCVYVWICFWHICYKYNKKLLWLVLPYRVPSMTSVNILLSLCVPWRKYLFLTDHVVIHTYQCLQNPRGLSM